MTERYERRPPGDYMPGYSDGALVLQDRYAEIFINDKLVRRILIQEYPATEIYALKMRFWFGWICGSLFVGLLIILQHYF